MCCEYILQGENGDLKKSLKEVKKEVKQDAKQARMIIAEQKHIHIT